MQAIFLTCLLIGGIVLVAQVVLSLIGLDTDTGADVSHVGVSDVGHGLELLSVRSLSAATVVYGGAGIWLNTVLPPAVAAGVAIVPAFGAALFSAWATRQMTRFDSSGTLQLQNAVGQNAYVTLTIRKDGDFGLVQVPVQGRTIELRATAREDRDIPEGSTVIVVAFDAEGQTVEVVPTSLIEEI